MSGDPLARETAPQIFLLKLMKKKAITDISGRTLEARINRQRRMLPQAMRQVCAFPILGSLFMKQVRMVANRSLTYVFTRNGKTYFSAEEVNVCKAYFAVQEELTALGIERTNRLRITGTLNPMGAALSDNPERRNPVVFDYPVTLKEALERVGA